MSNDTLLRDMQFALEGLPLSQVLASPQFRDVSPDDVTMMLDEADKLAQGVLAPLNASSDKEGARFFPKTGKVQTSKGYRDAFCLYAEAGWGNASMPAIHGGIGLPESVALACGELFIGACSSFAMVHGLTRSATDVIIAFGTDAQRKTYVPQMTTGMWTGTMCLTEPHAGSDVGAIKTLATPIEGKDGKYRIRGVKSFISFGEHDLAENIVHLVLARTPQAPKGTKGISLFIVPKMKVGADGTCTGKKNDVVCGGIEHKMGIHGSPTCTLNFGDKDNCEGELLGDVNEGMKYMFLMMNEARLLVGLQGVALAGAAYTAALAYARERVQGADLRDMSKQVAIIEHPDVRRMLMTMKAHTEGMRAFIYRVAHYIDMSRTAESPEDRKRYRGWVELLTPVVKAYCSDTGFHVAEIGVLVHGGAGYCRDLPAEQYVRDAMITRIYEGTNGIQALDLIARKIPMRGGTVLQSFAEEVVRELEGLKTHPTLGALAEHVEDELEGLSEVLADVMSRKTPEVALAASPVLEMFGTIASAFCLLTQAKMATERLDALYGAVTDESERTAIRANNADAHYYYSKVETARFFVEVLLPRVVWRMGEIFSKNTSALADVL